MQARHVGRGSRWLRLFLLTLLLALAAGAVFLWLEVTRSALQARYFSELGRQMVYRVEPGPSAMMRFPGDGPFDVRLGYSAIPAHAERLATQGYSIAAQARLAPRMAEVADRGLFLPYHEKSQAGLTLLDCVGDTLYQARDPQRTYADFGAVPPLVIQTLLFIENRELLSNRHPTKNPAVEWGRLARAVADQLLSRVDPDHPQPGGSTLATQIEKYRHSPGGVTDSPAEKLRQMVSATLRAYLDGEDTTAFRRQLVLDYLNTVPLAARPGHGEVIGLGDGLWVWYGSDFEQTNRLLRDPAAPLEERAQAYRQVLSLMIAHRRPSDLLLGGTANLERLTDAHLRLLAEAGVVDGSLRDAALAARSTPRQGSMERSQVSFVDRKATTALRTRLSALLGMPRLYDLDRLDLAATTTIDRRLQDDVNAVLHDIATPAGARAAGLIQPRLLANADPGGVTYSFTLYELTRGASVVRVQTDNFDQPFDVNEGTRLDLGSTAKLRTLVTYLEIVARLHGQLADLDEDALRGTPVASRDPIARWAVDYLLTARGDARSLQAMLEAALDRRYPASPGETFFTGGGVMRFQNFDAADDGRVVTVREALQRSINLPFVRLMRDIVQHTMFTLPSSSATLLDDERDPRRAEYLAKFAEREGRDYLRRFYGKYAGRDAQEVDALLVEGSRPTPRRLAAVYRYLYPEAGIDEFAARLRANLPEARIDDASIARLYRELAPERYDLADRGYIAGVHPLELWLAGYLRAHPQAALAEVLSASVSERQSAYAWLFKTRRKGAQDRRIRTLVELEAFQEIHRSWQRLGYPFASLTPSYATALGSSADRPAALAELVGILVADGIRKPVLRIGELRAAEGTPYETLFVATDAPGVRVLPVEVAIAARRVLESVVTDGTARRLAGTFRTPDGGALSVGGKTGTGDHRFETYGRGGELLSSRVVSRSGTFVFFLGDRFYGTLTAYVKGPQAADYSFTSALPTQVLKHLAPVLQGALDRPQGNGVLCVEDASLRAPVSTSLPRVTTGGNTPAGEALDTTPSPASVQRDALAPDD